MVENDKVNALNETENSMITIHSRGVNQKYNNNYKERLQTRCNFDTSNPKVMKKKLKQLKYLMKNPDNIYQSEQREDRFIIKCKDGYNWVLGAQAIMNSNKQVFVPVTVLPKNDDVNTV